MTAIKLEEVLEALTLKESVMKNNGMDYAQYFKAIIPEFSESDLAQALDGSITWFHLQALIGKEIDFLILETFARGIEFGRELERISNSRT